MKNITFLVSNKCNFRCRHCFLGSGLCLKDELTTKEKKEVIKKLITLGAKRLVFSGGEPLLNKDLFALINYTKNKGLRTSILTNGSLITRTVAHRLASAGLDDLAISIYSPDIIGLSQYAFSKYIQKTVKSVSLMQDEGIPCKLTYPSDGKNAEFIILTLSRFHELGIKPQEVRIFIITPVEKDGKQTYKMPSEDEWMNFIGQLRKEKEEFSSYRINYEINYVSNTSYHYGCPMQNYAVGVFPNFQDIHVDANGDIYLCCLLLRQQEHCVANLFNNSLDEIRSKIVAYGVKIKKVQYSYQNGDFCPGLNRSSPKDSKMRLVCPLLYQSNMF